MMQLSNIQAPVKRELEQFTEIFNSSLNSDNAMIEKMSKYVLSMQGKQMRPLFLLLSAAIHSNITSSSYNAAVFIELVHTASLIHDDVVDEAYMRRDKHSLFALQRGKVSILLGDYVLAKGLRMALHHKLYRPLEMVSTVIEEMSVGELIQSQHAFKLDITSESYFDIIRRKTALLLAACGASGAITAGASEQEVERMYQFGETLGVAFQIKDDILDYTSMSVTGKIACNDIKERKLTLPVISILENGTEEDKKELISMIRNVHKDSKIVKKIRAFVIDKGGITMAQTKMEELRDSAIALLDYYTESDVKSALIGYAHFVLNRTK